MKIYCDGGARGNPGPAACAFVVFSEDKKFLYKEGRFLGSATNNVAEYEALLMAVEWVSKNAEEPVVLVLDSQLVQKQMTGEYKIKNDNLKKLASRVKYFEDQIKTPVKYVHTLREGNPDADQLVNEILDENQQ